MLLITAPATEPRIAWLLSQRLLSKWHCVGLARIISGLGRSSSFSQFKNVTAVPWPMQPATRIKSTSSLAWAALQAASSVAAIDHERGEDHARPARDSPFGN